MASVGSWIITAFVALLVVALVLYLISLRLLPLAERPLTRTYNRFGELLGVAENPDYRENAVEEEPVHVLERIQPPPPS